MKYILLILALFAITGTADGQQALNAYNGSFVAKSSTDTTVNVDTTYLANTGSYSTDYYAGWQATVTNITGTTGGWVYLQGSNDFTNWYPVHRNSSEMIITSDSVTISGLTSGAATTFEFNITNQQFRFYRLLFKTSGTQTSTITGTAWLRKKVVIIGQK